MAHTTRAGTYTDPGGGRGDWRDTAARYALLPLRIFLGVTFVYAGLDKLTSDTFLKDTGDQSIGDQIRFLQESGDVAIPQMLDLAANSPVGFGYAIAFGELAVGIGTLIGLFARIAALGGALLSLSLWFTMSWSATPYYMGNDLPYLMAWLPLILAGASYWSVDAWLRGRRADRAYG
ncbi:DoxX family protein [Streptomyces sp. TRM66268-LWL]|uniref:DoxX family protein n=1 Tax=Streptomyces polyasparticus TaxID=2767826 RepID=A0ABR7SQN1_9ACTN|nr:DoxX family protein [Streptomyces polyasparticus]MBC9717272.1 DoxX family protein [Streptomyces polyasparticus]